MSASPAVSIDRVSKRFGATHALREVSLDLLGGEIHVLAGENGAGKSTLIRILAGAITDYEGEIRLGGELVRFGDPGDARDAGVACIHQELSVIGSMTVADNLALVERGSMWRRVKPLEQESRAREILGLLSLSVEPSARLETLPLATRQLIEIARALHTESRGGKAKLLILDEPTSALSESESERLFEQLARLRERGVAIVFISHRMDEIYRVADRITVLRDGALIATERPADLPRPRLVEHMVGEERVLVASTTHEAAGDELLSVKGPGVELSVREGEVVGVTGLYGSGAGALPRAIFGADPSELELAVAGTPVRRAPRACISRGLILLSGDRGESLVQSLSVVANCTLSALPAFSPRYVIDRAAEHRSAAALCERLHVDFPSLDAEVSQLSGGNQQKVAIGRCLQIEPRVLVLHEPSRGIDVAAKAEVHALVAELAGRGVAILVVGTDLEELMTITNRMYVMSRGVVTLELARGAYTRARILGAAMGEAS